jgi:hypothetical protein
MKSHCFLARAVSKYLSERDAFCCDYTSNKTELEKATDGSQGPTAGQLEPEHEPDPLTLG